MDEEEKVFVSLEMPAALREQVDAVVKALDTNRSAWLRAAVKRQLKIDLRKANKISPLPVSQAQG